MEIKKCAIFASLFISLVGPSVFAASSIAGKCIISVADFASANADLTSATMSCDGSAPVAGRLGDLQQIMLYAGYVKDGNDSGLVNGTAVLVYLKSNDN